jgi:membrane protein implicated in regulation of membrane protease activity
MIALNAFQSVWRSPAQPSISFSAYSLITDDIATVDTVISPQQNGRIRFQGTWWPARSLQATAFEPNEKVRVIGRDNITILVESI